MPILTFEPYFKSVIWGGERISQYKGIPDQGPTIGESWEISPMPGHESKAQTPGFEGQTLNQIVAERGEELMGRRLTEKYGGEFPMLVKIIDSNADLSIQVHPDDALARQRHGCLGKTEMWYSLLPTPDAYLYAGFNRRLSPAEYAERIASNTIVETLRRFNPKASDVFFLPAGRVHAIGQGNLVLEVQEASDITYRIYDYDRRDARGNPRELHVEQSLEAVNYDDTDAVADHVEPQNGCEKMVLQNSFFTITVLGVNPEMSLDLGTRDSFTVLFCTRGQVDITDPYGRSQSLRQGFSALVPAAIDRIELRGDADLVTAYIS